MNRKFDIGDRVRMPGVPFVVEVLEFGACDERWCAERETFRFKDPQTGEDDWMHVRDFEVA
jgi:hypothetical protein